MFVYKYKKVSLCKKCTVRNKWHLFTIPTKPKKSYSHVMYVLSCFYHCSIILIKFTIMQFVNETRTNRYSSSLILRTNSRDVNKYKPNLLTDTFEFQSAVICT